jgi:hypothetical protein
LWDIRSRSSVLLPDIVSCCDKALLYFKKQMLKSVATHVSDMVTLFGLTDPAAMSFVTHKHKYDI